MNKIIGQQGEDIAVHHLEAKGYKILERNLRLKIGEIDILAEQNNILIIVEVKSGRTGKFDMAIFRIGPQKQAKLRNLALALEQIYPNKNIRIDAINVDLSGNITHIENAIEEL